MLLIVTAIVIYSNSISDDKDIIVEHVVPKNLKHISCIESNCGKNKKHKTVKYGLNAGDSAAGAFGLMPITTKEIIHKSERLRSKYSYITKLSHNKINKIINVHENIDKEIASEHWARLSKIFPQDEIRRVYAWKNGITGAKRASKTKMYNDPYVKKFKALQRLDQISVRD